MFASFCSKVCSFVCGHDHFKRKGIRFLVMEMSPSLKLLHCSLCAWSDAEDDEDDDDDDDVMAERAGADYATVRHQGCKKKDTCTCYLH